MKLSYTILYVENVEQSIAFYEKTLGLKHRFTHEGGDYAEMETGATTLAFCAHSLAKVLVQSPYQKASKENLIGSQITFEPEDVKTAYQYAIDNGATSLCPPEVKSWNFEIAMLQDPDGHIVELAKNLN